jgi:hypothetical protein
MAAMDNFYRPPAGDPGDHQPTEQFWPGQGPPPGSQGPGNGYPRQQPGLQAHMATDRRRAWHWAVGITLATLLAGGGVIAGISLAGTSLYATPAASTGTGGAAGPGSTGAGGASATGGSTGSGSTGGAVSQAALLNSTLNVASSPDAAVATTGAGAAVSGSSAGAGPTPAATTPAARRCAQLVRTARAARLTGHHRLSAAARAAVARCRFIRRRIVRFFLLRGIDGQFTIRTRAGVIRTLAYQRGVIESVASGSSIVVRAADGTISTWDLVSNTVVRDANGKVSESTLAVGEPVWVGGPVVNGAKDARLIFVRPPSG